MAPEPTPSGMFSSAPSRHRTSVTDQIKDYILIHRLKPGELLPTEAELCAELGVSRSSVREAMRTLAALDIVEVRHGYGTYVGQLSLAPLVEGLVFRGVLRPEDDFAALREVVEVREALDLAMAEQICAAMVGTSNPRLHELVATMEEKSGLGEPFAEEDRASTRSCSPTSTTRSSASWSPRSGRSTPWCTRGSGSRPRPTSTRPPGRTATCCAPPRPGTSPRSARPS